MSKIQFSIDLSLDWQDMRQIAGTPIWEGYRNASTASAGAHFILVRAQGSTQVEAAITTSINPALPIKGPLPWLGSLLLDN